MTCQITRRVFLQRAAIMSSAAIVSPARSIDWLTDFTKSAGLGRNAASTGISESSRHHTGELGQREVISDDEIPTRFFSAGYTQDQFDQGLQKGDLKNGFPWGLADTHTLGGIPDARNITIDQDGSAVLSIRRPTSQEWTDWQTDSEKARLITEGAKNGVEMKLSVAALTGRLPTDVQSIEASITPPHGIQTGNLSAGIVGTGWSFWT